MPAQDTLNPLEASYIATNAYFALKDWINLKPVAGVESRANIRDRVLGPGSAGIVDPKQPNPTLQGTALAKAKLGTVYSATTGFGTESGFGYLLKFRDGSRRHTIIATRGTRPELGAADLLTDARGAMTAFPGYGPVHKGFRTTYDSAMVNLARDHRLLMESDVVHCVGHSLGGAVATLIAAHYAGLGKAVKLYTFGSPRVGAGGTFAAMHKTIGKDNIFRVAHDLDPISLIGPFPFIHVNPSPSDPNNFTIPSPTGSLFSTENHDMNRYIRSTGGEDAGWDYLRSLRELCDRQDWLLMLDDAKRCFTYNFETPAFPVKNYLATLRLYPVTHTDQTFAEEVGLTFQSSFESAVVSGKNLGTDLAEGKPTLPSLVFFNAEEDSVSFGRAGLREYLEGCEGRLMRR